MTIIKFGSVTLVHGDNAEWLATLPAEFAVVSDPPYGINYKHSGGGKGLYQNRHSRTVANDNVPFDPTPLMRFDDVVIFGANHYCKRLPDGGSWSVWDKRGNGRGPDDSFADAEFIWTKRKQKTRVFNYLWKGICKDGENGIRRLHPTQKPIALMEWCIGFTPSGATIVDPYMGAGTTGVAALRQGRPFFGIELERDHFDASCQRIEAEHARLQGEAA